MNKLIVNINIFHPKFGNEKGETFQDERIVWAICKSNLQHRMDTDRIVYINSNPNHETEMEKFKNDLKNRIYNDINEVDFIIIDERNTGLRNVKMPCISIN